MELKLTNFLPSDISFFNAGTATANSFKAIVSVGLRPMANIGSRSSLRSFLILC